MFNMNLIDFHVTRITSEEKGKVWELYGMTEAQLEEAKADINYPDWYYYLLGNGVKQGYEYVDMGGKREDVKIFNVTRGAKPYYVGYVGQH